MKEVLLIIDFGSQYTQLIARKVRELNVRSEIIPFNKFNSLAPYVKGVILSGSPHSVNALDAPKIDLSLIRTKVPLLALCYGAQYIAKDVGGVVEASDSREYGRSNLSIISANKLFKGIDLKSQVWMSHGDTILDLPNNTTINASTDDVSIAAFTLNNEETYALQFHPEVYHTKYGKEILANFLINICNFEQNWTSQSFINSTIDKLKSTLGSQKVLMGLSGGVDSTVAAVLLHHAIGDNLFCVFVDNGLLRKDEYRNVLHAYKDIGLNIKGVDASNQFLKNLNKVLDPEKKRKIIGSTFIDVFESVAQEYSDLKWLGQGTIYPDVIESISGTGGPSETIKSHHNVGGLPEKMNLKVIEPLKSLFKDEVRKVGFELNINPVILNRHPFPGPGLAIRIMGEVTLEKVQILQDVDNIFIRSLKDDKLYGQVWQAGAILLSDNSVGVMGDGRTYEKVVALRAVESTDGMTADWVHLPYDFLSKVSNDIINKVKGVNRVVYDISSKPPATIEWE
ncbi:MAG: glutamine-hydrolyzing GMP synthase [Flavobacteriales bacterium]|nr:glutamine-hydrolyzing GMP synthase [Flavobacteriales bacterium]|tara:strand:+ start:2759 stop:4288 length:1530 start_codon:yes stop_codon:yes gene_type:complete